MGGGGSLVSNQFWKYEFTEAHHNHHKPFRILESFFHLCVFCMTNFSVRQRFALLKKKKKLEKMEVSVCLHFPKHTTVTNTKWNLSFRKKLYFHYHCPYKKKGGGGELPIILGQTTEFLTKIFNSMYGIKYMQHTVSLLKHGSWLDACTCHLNGITDQKQMT